MTLGRIVGAGILCLVLRRDASAQLQAERWLAHAALGAGMQTSGHQNLSPVGLHLAAGVTRRLISGLGARLEVAQTRFGSWTPDDRVYAPCPPSSTTCGSALTTRIRVEGLALALIARRGANAFASVGAGWYHFGEHPVSRGGSFPGFNVGLSHVVADARPGFVLDAQLHWIPGVQGAGRWILPFRLVLTW